MDVAKVSNKNDVFCENQFAVLPVFGDGQQSIPEPLVPLVAPESQLMQHGSSVNDLKLQGSSLAQCFVSKCSTCGKKLPKGSVDQQCAKCANGSFGHLSDQLVDTSGSVVLPDCVEVLKTADVAAELVPLKQFVRAGKRGHYLNFGVFVIDQ